MYNDDNMIMVYSRQIAMLESTSKRQEQRLRAENECLEKEYQAKIIRIQVHFNQLSGWVRLGLMCVLSTNKTIVVETSFIHLYCPSPSCIYPFHQTIY